MLQMDKKIYDHWLPIDNDLDRWFDTKWKSKIKKNPKYHMILVTFMNFMVFRISISDNFYFIVHVFYNLLSFSMKRKTSDSFLAFIILRLVILYSITVCTTKYGSKNTLTALCCNTICLVSWGPYQWIFPLPKKHDAACSSLQRTSSTLCITT